MTDFPENQRLNLSLQTLYDAMQDMSTTLCNILAELHTLNANGVPLAGTSISIDTTGLATESTLQDVLTRANLLATETTLDAILGAVGATGTWSVRDVLAWYRSSFEDAGQPYDYFVNISNIYRALTDTGVSLGDDYTYNKLMQIYNLISGNPWPGAESGPDLSQIETYLSGIETNTGNTATYAGTIATNTVNLATEATLSAVLTRANLLAEQATLADILKAIQDQTFCCQFTAPPAFAQTPTPSDMCYRAHWFLDSARNLFYDLALQTDLSRQQLGGAVAATFYVQMDGVTLDNFYLRYSGGSFSIGGAQALADDIDSNRTAIANAIRSASSPQWFQTQLIGALDTYLSTNSNRVMIAWLAHSAFINALYAQEVPPAGYLGDYSADCAGAPPVDEGPVGPVCLNGIADEVIDYGDVQYYCHRTSFVGYSDGRSNLKIISGYTGTYVVQLHTTSLTSPLWSQSFTGSPNIVSVPVSGGATYHVTAFVTDVLPPVGPPGGVLSAHLYFETDDNTDFEIGWDSCI